MSSGTLVASRSAVQFATIAVSLVFLLVGMVIPMSGPTNVVPLNTADNVLHLVLAIGMVALGATLGRRRGARA